MMVYTRTDERNRTQGKRKHRNEDIEEEKGPRVTNAFDLPSSRTRRVKYFYDLTILEPFTKKTES